MIDIKFNFVNSKFSKKIKFFKPKIDTAPRIGIEIRKEIFAASVLAVLSEPAVPAHCMKDLAL